MRRIRKKPAQRSHLNLSRDQELALVICAAVHEAGCACEIHRTQPCSKMVWAAKRAMKHLGVPVQSAGEQSP